MPRRTAATRHTDTAPSGDLNWPPEGAALIDALIALHHPTRRRLYEVLTMEGPAAVGRLAERTGLAPGSVSHHLKALHKAGFIEPATDLARDTRESWWRGVVRSLTWSADHYAEGTAARQVVELAEQANLDHQDRASARWMQVRHRLPVAWRDAAHVADSYVRATPDQAADLGRRLQETVNGWRAECLADEAAHPRARRRPVRVFTRVFPSDPAAS